MTALRNFHEGEARIQAESGVDTAAFDAMVDQPFRPELNDSEVRFVNGRTFSAAATVDSTGRPWASPLFGPAGELFNVVDPTTVHIVPDATAGDPLLDNLASTGELGVIYFDPSRRRRTKSMGAAEVSDDGSIVYRMRRNFGICNKYIYKRSHEPARPGPAPTEPVVTPQQDARLSADDQRQLSAADTIFLSTFFADHGADVTHRGGPKGFVTVIDDTTISVPDYTGNGMFQTLGNLLLDDRVGLMSVDFTTGRTVHLTGRATVASSPDNDLYSKRTVTMTIEEVRTSFHNAGMWTDIEAFELRPGLINPATPYLPGHPS